jgi:AcrR family transcriptional regulator
LASVDIAERLRRVPRPAAVLPSERAESLSARQLEVLDELEHLLLGGSFASLTMAEVAGAARCSLRTLYELAPSKDQLVVTIVDRMLWRVGRQAARTIEADQTPLDALRAFLAATTDAVRDVTAAASLDLAATPGALEVARRHEQYLVGIIEALLAAAVDDGSVRDVDVGAFAVVLAGVGATLASTVGQAHLRSNPKSAADEVVDALLLGLRT